MRSSASRTVAATTSTVRPASTRPRTTNGRSDAGPVRSRVLTPALASSIAAARTGSRRTRSARPAMLKTGSLLSGAGTHNDPRTREEGVRPVYEVGPTVLPLPSAGDEVAVGRHTNRLPATRRMTSRGTSYESAAPATRTHDVPRPTKRQAIGPATTSSMLRRMQNSLPSGSASTTQPVPSSLRWSSTWVAPSPSSALDLLVAGAGAGSQVEVEPVLDRLVLRHLDEEQRVAAVGALDPALLVTGLVGVVRLVDVLQHLLPPLGELVGVAAVDRGVRDVRRHGAQPASTRTCDEKVGLRPCG